MDLRRLRDALLVLVVPIAVVLVTTSACSDDDDDSGKFVSDTGMVAGDFQSLADYIDNDVVQDILRHMPRYEGSTPPDVAGQYFASGVIEKAVPNDFQGLDVTADFCFGMSVNSQLNVTVIDPTVQDAGANSFIEGSGNNFTVYTAFKSVQTVDTGTTCEIHEINVYSGTREADGSISELYIAFGIVGLVGTCEKLLVGDYQVSLNTGERTGDACPSDPAPGGQPVDPNNVLVEVFNDLVVEVSFFVDDETVPRTVLPPLGSDTFEVSPGFVLSFETEQVIETDADPCNPDDLFLTDGFCGEFAPDTEPAGGTSSFLIENGVGDATYFAPLVLNATNPQVNVFSLVNGLDCGCALEPSVDPFVIGYYPYDIPGSITPDQVSVEIFDVADEQNPNATPISVFVGSELMLTEEPFRSGTVELRVE